jgi:hypothetical protein
MSFSKRRALLAMALGLGAAALAARARIALASDHQDTPEVELNQRMDINDLYAFPGASAGRIALVLTTASPITPAQAQAGFFFDPNLLYQIKIDNTGDGIEDLVFQVTFDGSGANQRVHVMGPVKPNETGTSNTLISGGPEVSGPINQVLGATGGTQVYAGLRDDPFWIDLEQFFRIIPDRKPVSGTLSQLPEQPSATAWRNPGIDFLRGLDALAIAIELPNAQLSAGGMSKIGVWSTISR